MTQKNGLIFMIKNGIYSAENLEFYLYFKYLQEKLLKMSHFNQIMLFVGL